MVHFPGGPPLGSPDTRPDATQQSGTQFLHRMRATGLAGCGTPLVDWTVALPTLLSSKSRAAIASGEELETPPIGSTEDVATEVAGLAAGGDVAGSRNNPLSTALAPAVCVKVITTFPLTA